MANNKIIYNSKVLLDLTQDTVSSEKLLANTTAHDRSGNIITGTIETKSSDDLIVNGATINVPKGYYSIQASKSVSSITQATPSISVSSSGLVTATSTQSAGYVVAGTKSATKQLSTKGSATYTPTTTNLTISSGLYLTGNQIIKGDSNLKAENIKSGVSIFGIAGTLEEGTGGTYENGDNLTYGEEGYTVTVKEIVGTGTIRTPTRIKINAVPTSSTDYNTATFNGTTYSNVTKVYIWGYSYGVNDEATVYLGNTSYDNATVLEINSDCEITLRFRNYSSGGAGD